MFTLRVLRYSIPWAICQDQQTSSVVVKGQERPGMLVPSMFIGLPCESTQPDTSQVIQFMTNFTICMKIYTKSSFEVVLAVNYTKLSNI